MRHMNKVKTLNKKKSHRRALFQNLANALFDHESIKTTSPKAMELKKVADKLITLAKRKDMHAMRLAFSILRNKEIVRKLFTDIGERYTSTSGGYTRVLRSAAERATMPPWPSLSLPTRKRRKRKKKKRPRKRRPPKRKPRQKKKRKRSPPRKKRRRKRKLKKQKQKRKNRERKRLRKR